MPTTYTHYAYGQDVFYNLPPKIQKEIRPYMDYYNIGVHGPDILFYYHCFHKNKINQYGVEIHNRPAEVFFRHAFRVFGRHRGRKAEAAYLAGFMTHFILDSDCHPYIRKRMEETGISHEEIEADWDSQMLRRDHKNPVRYKRARHIRTDLIAARVIAPYYHKTPRQIQVSLINMKWIVNYVFRSGFGVKKLIASCVNHFVSPKINLRQFFTKEEINPKNIDTCHHLWELYEESQPVCVKMITQLYQALIKKDISFCHQKRLFRDFS